MTEGEPWPHANLFEPKPPCDAVRLLSQCDDSHANKEELDDLVIETFHWAKVDEEGEYETLADVMIDYNEFFFPWENATTDANKVYFAKKGGLQLLLHFLDAKWPVVVSIAAAQALWNFGGSELRLRAALGEGALTAVMRLLPLESHEAKTCALGALWSYLEFEDVQQKAVEEGVVDLILPILEGSDSIISADDGITLFTVGCLQGCASNARCRQELITKGVAEKFIQVCGRLLDRSIMTRYLGSIALAALLLHVEGEAKLIEAGASNAVTQFQAAYTVDMIAEEEKNQGVVYSFIEPFLQLFLSHRAEVKTLGAFAFAVLVQKESNKQTIVKEGLLPALVCLSWVPNVLVRTHMARVIAAFAPGGLPVPSLLQISLQAVREKLWPEYVPSACLNLLPEGLGERVAASRKRCPSS